MRILVTWRELLDSGRVTDFVRENSLDSHAIFAHPPQNDSEWEITELQGKEWGFIDCAYERDYYD